MKKVTREDDVPVAATWRRAVTEWMLDSGITRAELARRLGVTRGAITQLFSTAKRSSLVAPIDKMMAESPGQAERVGRSDADAKIVERVRRCLESLEIIQDDEAEAEIIGVIAGMSLPAMQMLFDDLLKSSDEANEAVRNAMRRVHDARMALSAADLDMRRAEHKRQESLRSFDRLQRMHPRGDR